MIKDYKELGYPVEEARQMARSNIEEEKRPSMKNKMKKGREKMLKENKLKFRENEIY